MNNWGEGLSDACECLTALKIEELHDAAQVTAETDSARSSIRSAAERFNRFTYKCTIRYKLLVHTPPGSPNALRRPSPFRTPDVHVSVHPAQAGVILIRKEAVLVSVLRDSEDSWI